MWGMRLAVNAQGARSVLRWNLSVDIVKVKGELSGDTGGSCDVIHVPVCANIWVQAMGRGLGYEGAKRCQTQGGGVRGAYVEQEEPLKFTEDAVAKVVV